MLPAGVCELTTVSLSKNGSKSASELQSCTRENQFELFLVSIWLKQQRTGDVTAKTGNTLAADCLLDKTLFIPEIMNRRVVKMSAQTRTYFGFISTQDEMWRVNGCSVNMWLRSHPEERRRDPSPYNRTAPRHTNKKHFRFLKGCVYTSEPDAMQHNSSALHKTPVKLQVVVYCSGRGCSLCCFYEACYFAEVLL